LKYGISQELALVLEKVGKYGASKRSIPLAKEFLGKRSVILVGCLKILRHSYTGPKKVQVLSALTFNPPTWKIW